VHRVEWLRFRDKYERRAMPLPASLAHLKWRISEKKWPEAIAWPRQRISLAAYKLRDKQRIDPLPARADKSTARR
jgi:hypothetical protein